MSKELVLSLDQGRVTQTEVWAAPNFSFKQINLDETITVPVEQQMIVNDRVRVEGFFRVDGEAYVCMMPQPEPFPEIPGDNYSHFEVLSPKLVPASQEMILTQALRVQDMIRVDGRVSILGSEPEPENDSIIPNVIAENKRFNIGLEFEHYFRGFLKISGSLRCSGSFAIGV